MKTYDNVNETPLRFHRVYAAVVLPIDLFINLFNLLTYVSAVSKGGDFYDYLALGETVVFLSLIIIAFRGLLLFRRSGLIAALALTLLQIASNAYTLYLSFVAGDAIFITASVFSIVIMSSIFIYYFIRRRLFTPMGMKAEEILALNKGRRVNTEAAPVYTPIVEEESVDVEEEEEEVGEYDCPRCGFHITDGKVFCPKCGAQTRVVR